MRTSDDLFTLIRTLTASEKGYFRKQVTTQGGGANNYLRLFDAMAKQQQYDEAAIKKQFTGAVFVRQLNTTKLYLFQLILKHLGEYHRHRSIKMQARAYLDDAEMLIHKGLYKLAEKKLQSHKKFISKYQYWISLFEASDYAESIYNRIGASKEGILNWKDLYVQRENLMQLIAENYAIRKMERELLLLNQKLGPTRNAKALNEFETFARHPMLKGLKPAASLDTQFRFNQIHAILALHRSDYKKEADYFRRNVELIEAHPAMMEAFYKEYYPVALHNFINASLIANEFDAAYEALGKLRDAELTTKAQRARSFYFLMRDQTYYWIRKKNPQRGLALKKEYEKGLENLHDAMNPDHITTIHFNFAVLHLHVREFGQSINYLEKALESRHQPAFENIQSFARILLIINHFELGNLQLLPHLISTTEFFLKKKQIFFEHEKAILQFFKKISSNAARSSVKKEAAALKLKLKTLFKNPLEKNAALVFDFSDWLETLPKN